MANILYVRVSSKDQNPDRQYDLLYQYLDSRGITVDKVFEDRASGANTQNRPKFNAMLQYIRSGDCIYCESISRFSRNVRDFIFNMEYLESKEVAIVFLKENLLSASPTGRLMTGIFIFLAQYERDLIKSRQEEGIRLALKEGRPYGRPKKIISDTFPSNYRLWKRKSITTKEFMKRENLSKTTFYRKVKEYESKK